MEYCKAKKVSITTKVTGPEHTKRVEFFCDINNKIRLVQLYKSICKRRLKFLIEL